MPDNWSESEVEAAVEDYFNMLRLELAGRSYNKSQHRRDLKERLNKRSDGSVELKHQNISAVLIEMGIQWIDGYKPRSNYQRRLLPEAVEDYLRNNPELQTLFKADAEKVPSIPSVEDFLVVMEEPPKQESNKSPMVEEDKAIYNPGGINYLEREAQNQLLGEAGEQFVINFERARLIHAGRESLADRIEQISATVGPSAGFDILSFEESGADRFIEAKTTKYGKNTPFFVTPNELRFSRENAPSYFLYRVFKFRAEPRVFTLQGHLRNQCVLKPSQYLADPA
jgi:hypothetical protein